MVNVRNRTTSLRSIFYVSYYTLVNGIQEQYAKQNACRLLFPEQPKESLVLEKCGTRYVAKFIVAVMAQKTAGGTSKF
jgi:hypothetical protein